MSFQTNILFDASENRNFRTVLYTGEKSQLVVMSIPPDGEIGLETHDSVEQIIFIQSGTGFAFYDEKRIPLKEGDVLVITPGTAHNIINLGKEDLKIYTVYTPPNHLDGRIHATMADAELDREDEKFSADRNANDITLLEEIIEGQRP